MLFHFNYHILCVMQEENEMEFKLYSMQFKNPETGEIISVNVNGKISIMPERDITPEEYFTYSFLAEVFFGGGVPIKDFKELKECFSAED